MQASPIYSRAFSLRLSPALISAERRRRRRERDAATSRRVGAIVHDDCERTHDVDEVGVPRPRLPPRVGIDLKGVAVSPASCVPWGTRFKVGGIG